MIINCNLDDKYPLMLKDIEDVLNDLERSQRIYVLYMDKYKVVVCDNVTNKHVIFYFYEDLAVDCEYEWACGCYLNLRWESGLEIVKSWKTLK
jgi:hypothetical protein